MEMGTIKGSSMMVKVVRSLMEEGGHYIRKERSFGSFKRSFYIGDVDDQAIKGNFKDGVLHLAVPKPAEKESGNGKRIEIE